MEIADLVPVVSVLLAGSVIQAMAGFGLGMFSIPLLLWLGHPSWVAIPICVATTLVQSAYGLAQMRRHVDWRGLLPLAWLPALAMPLGVMAQAELAELGPARTRQAYGALILALLLVQLAWRARPREHVGRGWTLAAMLSGGFMSGSAGMGGPPIVLWVMAHTWGNERSRSAILLLFACMAPAVTALLWLRFGSEVPRAFGLGLLLAPLGLLGFAPGLWLGRRIPKAGLRLLAYAILATLSLYAIARPGPT